MMSEDSRSYAFNNYNMYMLLRLQHDEAVLTIAENNETIEKLEKELEGLKKER